MRSQHQKPIGEQWVCNVRMCAAINFPKRPECYKCGFKRSQDKPNQLRGNRWPVGWICVHCSGNNWAIRDKCYQCRAPKREAFKRGLRPNFQRRSSPSDFAHRNRNHREDKLEMESRRFSNGQERVRRLRRDDKDTGNESEAQPRIKSIVSTGPNEDDVDISQFDLSDFATIDEAKREEQNKNREIEREKNDRNRHLRRDYKERKHEEDSRYKSRSDDGKPISRSSKSERRDGEREAKRSRRTRSESDETNENTINLNASKELKKPEARSNSSRQIHARSASSSSSSSSNDSSDDENSESHKRSRKRTSASKRRYR